MPPDRSGTAAPDSPTPQAIAADRSTTSWRAFVNPERLGEVGSTNAELLGRAALGAPEGTVLIAETQSDGRGRLGRRWIDRPGGSLLCSLLFRPIAPEDRALAPLAVSLAALDACRHAGARCALKWPNDLVDCEEGRKFGGLLSEVGEGGAVVVGIGINVNWGDGDEVPPGATCLDRLVGPSIERDALAERLLEGVRRRWRLLRPGRRHAHNEVRHAYAEYCDACATLGQEVDVLLAHERFSGRATDVDEAGRLVVVTRTGARVVEAADVVHVRRGTGPPPG